MGLRIKSNVESLIAQRHLGESTRSMQESLEKLSSGQRINKSADDAAGLAVSEQIRARVRSLDVAKRNASDGISYIQVAEGGLNEVTNIVVRMRELASQAASDTVGQRERQFLNKEFQQMRQEVRRILESTEFNGAKVLRADGAKAINIFVGASNRGNNVNGEAPDIQPESDPDILTIDTEELAGFAAAMEKVTEDGIGILPPDGGGATDLGPSGTNDLFNRLDTSLNQIADYRATLGSIQSRLNSTIANAEISAENLSAAQSRIRDVDYASETAKFAQAKILTQAGLSVQAQANALPDMALQLIRAN